MYWEDIHGMSTLKGALFASTFSDRPELLKSLQFLVCKDTRVHPVVLKTSSADEPVVIYIERPEQTKIPWYTKYGMVYTVMRSGWEDHLYVDFKSVVETHMHYYCGFMVPYKEIAILLRSLGTLGHG